MAAILTSTGQATDVLLPDYQVLNLTKKDEHPFLRIPAQRLSFPLTQEDLRDVSLLEQKFDQEGNCAGLAAPQIGISKRMIVLAAPNDPILKKWRPDLTQTMPKTIWINPSYEALTEETREDYEACFSVGEMAGLVKRYVKIRYQAYDVQGKEVSGTADGFLARIIQHEIDHLNGKLFIDYVAPGSLLTIEEYRAKRAAAMKSE